MVTIIVIIMETKILFGNFLQQRSILTLGSKLLTFSEIIEILTFSGND
jgi:hypothetical protein